MLKSLQKQRNFENLSIGLDSRAEKTDFDCPFKGYFDSFQIMVVLPTLGLLSGIHFMQRHPADRCNEQQSIPAAGLRVQTFCLLLNYGCVAYPKDYLVEHICMERHPKQTYSDLSPLCANFSSQFFLDCFLSFFSLIPKSVFFFHFFLKFFFLIGNFFHSLSFSFIFYCYKVGTADRSKTGCYESI